MTSDCLRKCCLNAVSEAKNSVNAHSPIKSSFKRKIHLFYLFNLIQQIFSSYLTDGLKMKFLSLKVTKQPICSINTFDMVYLLYSSSSHWIFKFSCEPAVHILRIYPTPSLELRSESFLYKIPSLHCTSARKHSKTGNKTKRKSYILVFI